MTSYSVVRFNLPHNIQNKISRGEFSTTPKLLSKAPKFRLNSRADVAVQTPDVGLNASTTTTVDLFACPICYEPLIRKGPPGLKISSISRSGFQCEKCKKTYSSRDVYLDLTITAGLKEYIETNPVRTELFRSPVVSFVYERGWRQNFARRGFPGPDEEFKMAQRYLRPAEGSLLVDVSCGSGLFSRRFAKCGDYSGVIALDFSENMLRQCYEFVKQDRSLSAVNLALVRADVARLPFLTSSVAAIHAGAALHCWPSPSSAVAEISRILRPGGVFVATTFLSTSLIDSFTPDILKPLRQAVRASSSYSYLTEKEIKDLCLSCGLVDYSSIKRQAFIMLSARKPE